MTDEERNSYCKGCKRSIWGDSSCDVNVENNGKYVGAEDKCYCKCDGNGMVEKYSFGDKA